MAQGMMPASFRAASVVLISELRIDARRPIAKARFSEKASNKKRMRPLVVRLGLDMMRL